MNEKKHKSIFFYLLTPFILQWGVSFLVQFLAQSFLKDASFYTAELTVAIAIVIIPIAGLLYKRDSLEMGQDNIKNVSIKDCIIVGLLAISACILLNVCILFLNISELSSSYSGVEETIYNAPLAIQVIGMGMLVPVMEELLYRGLLYRRMRSFLSPKTTILFTALIFGFLHGNLVQFLFATGLGILLAFVYERYGCIELAIEMHIAINFTSIFLSWIGGFDKMISGEWIGLILLSLVMGIGCFWKMLQKC